MFPKDSVSQALRIGRRHDDPTAFPQQIPAPAKQFYRITYVFYDMAQGDRVKTFLRETRGFEGADEDIHTKLRLCNGCRFLVQLHAKDFPSETFHPRQKGAVATTDIEEASPPGSL